MTQFWEFEKYLKRFKKFLKNFLNAHFTTYHLSASRGFKKIILIITLAAKNIYIYLKTKFSCNSNTQNEGLELKLKTILKFTNFKCRHS